MKKILLDRVTTRDAIYTLDRWEHISYLPELSCVLLVSKDSRRLVPTHGVISMVLHNNEVSV